MNNQSKNDKGKVTLDRRQFLKSASVALAGTTLASGPAISTARGEKPTRRQVKGGGNNGLNLIFIVADTTRADFLGCYGGKWVKTPHLDKLAGESVTFDNCYADGLPTIPSRRVYHTGMSILPLDRNNGWHELEPDDITLATVLKAHGITTGFIVDTYHYFKPDMNFHRDFDSWEWTRGQETDRWQSGPREKFSPEDHIPPHLRNERYLNNMRQYLMNTQDRRGEEDYFVARTMLKAARWLERNRGNQPFMLFIDTFDPHEPWDAPERFKKMYFDKYPCERFLFGYGVKLEDIRQPEDLPAIRALYAAELSFVDMWIGRFLDRVKDLGLLDNTVIVFSTDHGTHLGEEGCVQKQAALLNSCVARLPLIIRHPDSGRYGGKRVKALVSATDYMPTFLHLLGVQEPELGLTGKNIWDIVDGKTERVHDRLFTGYRYFAAVRDFNWHYFQHIKGEARGRELYYKGKKIDINRGPALYDLKNDPGEKHNVVDKYPEVAREMKKLIARRFNVNLG